MNQHLCQGTFLPKNPLRVNFTFSAKERDTETGLSYFGSRYYSSDLSIWLSVDPMVAKYPGLSPFTYCADNPIKLVDPNGRDVVVTGTEAEAYTLQLSTKNLIISRGNDGKLSYTGKAKTRTEKQIAAAIDSKDVTVNICAENTNKVEGINAVHNGGAFLGTTYEVDNQGKEHVNTFQQVNPKELSNIEKQIGVGQGMYARHELTESYEAGLISLANKKSSPMAGLTGSVYSDAHDRASFAYDLIKIEISFNLPNNIIFKNRNISFSIFQIDPNSNY